MCFEKIGAKRVPEYPFRKFIDKSSNIPFFKNLNKPLSRRLLMMMRAIFEHFRNFHNILPFWRKKLVWTIFR